MAQITIDNQSGSTLQFTEYRGTVSEIIKIENGVKRTLKTSDLDKTTQFVIHNENSNARTFFRNEGKLEDNGTYTVEYKKDEDELILLQNGSAIGKYNDLLKTLLEFRKQAFREGFMVTVKGQVDYERAREISNSYFNLFPGAVAFPKTAKHVATCISFCADKGIPFRVRSGGHQHEAMSSSNNVLMIRLTEFNQIEYNTDKTEAWIGTGKKLQNVYWELEQEKRWLPGGGCQSVNPGGLTQGGGWGAGTRMYGMTCDSLVKAEVVLSDGSVVYPDEKNHPELFWALRGGGGGNFGIVTRFYFKLQTLKKISTTSLNFSRKEYASKVISTWMEMMGDPETPKELIITLFLSANYKETRNNSDQIRVFFRFFGDGDGLNKWVTEFSSRVKGNELTSNFPELLSSLITTFDFDMENAGPKGLTLQEHDHLIFSELYRGSPELDKIPSWLEKQLAPPGSTCDMPHPHKVSSAFQLKNGRKAKDQELAGKIAEYAGAVKDFPHANAYITLHALGGQAATEPAGGRAFYFGDRNYLLQFQAWWSNPGDPQGKDYINWVENFRKEVDDLVEGAFINFVDYHLVEDPTTLQGRLDLLDYYYGENLPRLRKVKRTYDKKDLFNFRMSIPKAD